MKSFICKGIIVIFLVVLADILFGAVYKPIIKKLPNSGLSQTDSYYALNRETADVIILGASNAKRGYNPVVFNEYGFSSVYNAALDGNEMIYHLAVLKSIMERQCPKIVILDINTQCFDGGWFNRLINHKHLYWLNVNVRNMLIANDVDRFIQIKMLSSFYTYNGTLPWVVRAYLKGNRRTDLHGFDPLEGTKVDEMETTKNDWDGAVNNKELVAFHELIDLCQNEGISLYVCIAPTYRHSKSDFSVFIQKEMEGKSIRFIDYSNDGFFLNHKELFFDESHLNRIGADEYTKKIAHQIKDYYFKDR